MQCHSVHHDRCLSNVSKTEVAKNFATLVRQQSSGDDSILQSRGTLQIYQKLCRYQEKKRKSTKISPCLGGNVPTPQDLLTGGVPQCTRGRWHQTQRFFDAPVQVPGDFDFR